MLKKLIASWDKVIGEIRKDPAYFETLPKNLRENIYFFRRAIEAAPRLFCEATPEQANDLPTALAAAQGYYYNFKYLGPDMKKVSEIILTLFPQSDNPLLDIPLHISLLKNKDFLLKALPFAPKILHYALRRHRDLGFFEDTKFINDAVRVNWNILLSALASRKTLLNKLILRSVPDALLKEHLQAKALLNRLDIYALRRIQTLADA